jgi:hypothetical protein
MFRNYITIALRNLTRNRVFSFINIAGLSLGLACCLLILLYAKDELSFDRFQKNGASLYRITCWGCRLSQVAFCPGIFPPIPPDPCSLTKHMWQQPAGKTLSAKQWKPSMAATPNSMLWA